MNSLTQSVVRQSRPRQGRSLTCILAGVLVIAGAIDHAPAAARKTGPRYLAPEVRTNVYSVKIESRGEGEPETIAGNVYVTAKPGPSNGVTLCFRGTLTPRREGSGNRTSISVNSYGMTGNRPRWTFGVTLAAGCELQIDSRGHILRVAGDQGLPVPLGAIAQSFVELLPAGSDSRWEVSDEMAVFDEPQSIGPALGLLTAQANSTQYYSSMGTRNVPAMVAVTRKIKYEAKGARDQILTVRKQMSLTSGLLVGREPKFSATGEGEFEFDPVSGTLRRLEMQYKAVVNTESVTKRSASAIHLDLLEGKELEAALEKGPAPRATAMHKLTPEELDKVVEDLKSGNGELLRAAAIKLQSSEVTNARPALLQVMSGLLGDSDSTLRTAAERIITSLATAEQVPALLRILNGESFMYRTAAIQKLGQLKDKRAIGPLVEMLASGGQDSYGIAEALGKFGPEAEDAVLPLLKEKHAETRRSACNILKQLGTVKSIQPLSELFLDRSQMVGQAAGEALRAIKARQ